MSSRRSFDFRRRRSERVVAGVAGGLADNLGVPDGYVRAAFITLSTIWGLGVLVYLGFWLASFDELDNREPVASLPHQSVGLAIGFIGLMGLLAAVGWWPNPVLVFTVGALSFGTAALTDSSRQGPLAVLMEPNNNRFARIRTLGGIALLIGGLSLFSTTVGQFVQVGIVALATLVTGLGILVAFGPWVRRLVSDLGEERRERIRHEEKSEMAAHLHDSVLQTLALIQRSDDPARTAMLARHQESELRDWLYGNVPLDGVDLISTALKAAAKKVELDHQIPVDVVTVGDHPLNQGGVALVGAASEALVNAAKHSGSDRLSLYLENEGDELVAYVTDQGKGFDPDSVPGHRKGISQSIQSRMKRAGGRAEIHSDLGEGTEVILKMPVDK